MSRFSACSSCGPAGRHGAARRRLVLGAAGAALLPVAGEAFPGAKAPILRPLVPAGVQAAIDGSGIPATAFGVFVQPLREARPGPAAVPQRKGRGRTPAPASLPPLAPLVMLHADVGFLLASTTKVVTSLAALDLLGPGFRWQTRAYTTGALSKLEEPLLHIQRYLARRLTTP